MLGVSVREKQKNTQKDAKAYSENCWYAGWKCASCRVEKLCWAGIVTKLPKEMQHWQRLERNST